MLISKATSVSTNLLRVCFALRGDVLEEVYCPETLDRIRSMASVAEPIVEGADWRSHADILAEAEILFSSWGAPVMDNEFLENAGELRAVFYAAGSVRCFTTPEFWKRGIRLSSAYAINAVPVCEYTLGAILLGLKHFWHYARISREGRTFPVDRPVLGAYRTKIGLVSYGTIARMVRDKLKQFDVEVLVFDPFLSQKEAVRNAVDLVSLDELFDQCDVVSVHTPLLKSTYRMIGRAQLDRLKPSATLINTARGAIIEEEEMIAFLRDRPDVHAVLDVTDPEPPVEDSPLYDLPNVILTPHIAGSLGPECYRMGVAMADEFERYLAGAPLQWELSEAKVAMMA